MNNNYTFIDESINLHFESHYQRWAVSLRITQQYWCHICFSPSDTPTDELTNFFNWIHELGAISGSLITEQLFEDIININFNIIQPQVLQQRIIQLLNTLTYQKQHTIEEQVYFIKILVEKFINQEFKEESNPSEGLYSETTSDTETTEVNYILTGNNTFISEFNTYPDYSIINYEITNMTTQQVIDAIGNLVTSLNQRNNEKMIIQI